MLEESRGRIAGRLKEDDLVLDVGGWAQPFERADWVIDLMPFETRGLYGYDRATANERFTAETWLELDICDRRPWPFADKQFDFVVCSQTLEDVRDPVWVCSETVRVGRAGYIEVPSRLQEQSVGVHGPWVGWSHHRWLVDIEDGSVEFVFKPHAIHLRVSDHFSRAFYRNLPLSARSQVLWWESRFRFRERIFMEPAELDAYLADFVAAHDSRGRRRRRRASWRRAQQ